MDHFSYIDGELSCQGLRLADIAATHGTPTFVYSRSTIEDHLRKVQSAFSEINAEVFFSVKSCSNIHILRALLEAGAGLDVVSMGELHRARLAGARPDQIVFAGVGKTDAEIRAALTGDGGPIAMFNVESEPEYEALALAARSLNTRAHAALRVNPDIKAGGHSYISTGQSGTKFGVDIPHAKTLLRKFNKEKHLPLTAIHLHLGSSITSPDPYVQAVKAVLDLITELRAEGLTIDTLDLGGGFAADYHTGDAPSPDEYARALVPLLKPLRQSGTRILLEPGRMIVANAGVLLTRVTYVKHAASKKFLICDAGMNALIRPALYDAFHFIWPTSVSPQHEPNRRADNLDMPGLEPCDIVGPLCETGDFFALNRKLPVVARGETLAIFTAGAYGMSMASRYNSHPLPAEVLVEGSSARLIRKRESLHDLTSHER
jgi:diaminopimelate decarboxylase